MKRTLNVVYDGKVFRPEEPLDLKPNTHTCTDNG
ncbi:MAG: antitoxin family protein [Thermodesulfobacteriota bacterium]|nr:antitoxin family protein [Thermodesulfobacteriota bacterium]